ncbi:efflux RND transporter periplasmic adaptor subunit [Limisalsivibrio acetivorans]|uniref:efflux RND transporter periplasmic adaptor subunit n=1 Tax=Limisalsivibrio acetivorans TaxID=1304888 RepID=UPI0003B37FB0|nr:efflux RND transporter periplasmic adaptor subunit [Limisalsivibrio acetivorans]
MKKNLAVVLCFFFIIAGCGGDKQEEKPAVQEKKPVLVKAAVARNTGDSKELTYPALIEASKKVKLSFEVDGYITAMHFEEGERVNKGALAAVIDDKEYIQNLRAVEATYKERKLNYQRIKKLYEQGATAKSAYDQAKVNYEVAETTLKLRRKDLRDTKIHAPFSGVISEKYADEYQQVNPKEPVYELQDLSRFDVSVRIPENLMAHYGEEAFGDAELLARNGSEHRLPLTLKKINTVADPKTQTYEIVYTLHRQEGISILPGMTASVLFTIDGISEQFTLVPLNAVAANSDGSSYVWVIDMETMKPVKTEITTASVSGGDVQVLSGLKGGEVIIAAGVHKVVPNMELKLLNPEIAENRN